MFDLFKISIFHKRKNINKLIVKNFFIQNDVILLYSSYQVIRFDNIILISLNIKIK